MSLKKEKWKRFKSPSIDKAAVDNLDGSQTRPAAAAISLTTKQQTKALNAKLNKQSKAVLYTPYNPVWPVLKSEVVEDIHSRLRSSFTKVSLVRKKVTNFDKEKRQAETSKLRNEESGLIQNLRSQLSIGINRVTRDLECDKVRLVLVNTDAPWQLHKHLVQLSSVRGCPAAGLRGLADVLAPCLGVTSLSALAFKKTAAEDENYFDDLVEYIGKHVPKIDLPWIELHEHIQSIKAQSEEGRTKTDKTEHAVGAPTNKLGLCVDKSARSPKDYSHLYIYKKDKSKEENMKTSEQDDFISFGGVASDSDSDTGPGQSSARSSLSQTLSQKTKPRKRPHVKASPDVLGMDSGESDKKEVKLDLDSGFVSPNIGKLVPNKKKNKQKKKRK